MRGKSPGEQPGDVLVLFVLFIEIMRRSQSLPGVNKCCIFEILFNTIPEARGLF